MNNKQRKQLERISALLEKMKVDLGDDIIPEIESIQEEEEEKYGNASEGLQATANYERMWEIADTLDGVVTNLNDVVSVIEDAISEIDGCCA